MSAWDFAGLALVDGHVTELDLSATEPKRLTIIDTIIETVIFPSRSISGIEIRKCLIGNAFGVSNELPGWIVETPVSHYDSVVNVASIKNVRLSISASHSGDHFEKDVYFRRERAGKKRPCCADSVR
jgi:hypothetical protein